jgi:hypothetical protein
MKTTFVMMTFAAIGLAACDAGDQAEVDVDSVEVGGLDGKSDSLFYPTEMGPLQLLTAQTQNLAPRDSGYQVYTFEGKRGWDVTFVQKSAEFRTYFRLYAPSGRRWSRSGIVNADNGAYYSTLDVTLPEDGTYTVLATSYSNMRYYPSARTSGEYTLSADAQIFCGGFAPNTFQCPTYLKCLLHVSNPDAAGTCALPTACYQPGDCQGLRHPECAIGPSGGWHCNADGRDAMGNCGYVCGGW